MTKAQPHDNISELRLMTKQKWTLTNKQQCNPENSKKMVKVWPWGNSEQNLSKLRKASKFSWTEQTII